MKEFFKYFIFIAVVFSSLSFMSQQVRADLSITPTLIAFEDRDRFASVTLINTGTEQTTYQMGWRFFRMQETGPAYKPSDTAITEFDLSKYIVFTPRRVTLAPGAKQKVRLALRRPEDVPSGDHHAHLEFAPVMDVAADRSQGNQKASAGINITVGYTIPVIFRAGDVDVNIDIGNIEITRNENNGKLKALISVNRSGGGYGALGHLYIYHRDGSGNEQLVGELANANIFPEVDRRVFDITLNKTNLTEGALRVVLEHANKNLGDRFVYAEKTLPLK